MKQPQKFYRCNTTPEYDKLLDLCELFGNQADGVSAMSLGKVLYANGIRSIAQFNNISIADMSKFDGVGPKRVAIFIKMKDYLKNDERDQSLEIRIEGTEEEVAFMKEEIKRIVAEIAPEAILEMETTTEVD